MRRRLWLRSAVDTLRRLSRVIRRHPGAPGAARALPAETTVTVNAITVIFLILLKKTFIISTILCFDLDKQSIGRRCEGFMDYI